METITQWALGAVIVLGAFGLAFMPFVKQPPHDREAERRHMREERRRPPKGRA